MNWCKFLRHGRLVIVHELNGVRVAVDPPETDTPLVIDPNAVLPGSIAAQLLQSIAGRRPQVVESDGRIDVPELAQHRSTERRRKPP
jgi:hypothetical protein